MTIASTDFGPNNLYVLEGELVILMTCYFCVGTGEVGIDWDFENERHKDYVGCYKCKGTGKVLLDAGP